MLTQSPFGGWVYARDLEQPVPGRPDDPETVGACVDYLQSHDPRDARRLARRALAGVAAGQVAVQVKHQVGQRAATPALSPSVNELEGMRATINRLLAFVPDRAAALPDARLVALSQLIQQRAPGVFAEYRGVVVVVRDEDDPETEASHRVLAVVTVGAEPDAETEARSVFDVHRLVVGALTPEERRAVRLQVDVEVGAPGRESSGGSGAA